MVNSVGKDMNLASGKVAPVISKKAGPQLQAACSAIAPIKPGEVKATDGYGMPCQKILHCCCPGWSGPASTQVRMQYYMIIVIIIKHSLMKYLKEEGNQ